MQQIVDLQNDPDFQSLGVEVLSVAFDSQAEQLSGAIEFGITDVPLLVDSGHKVSTEYDVLKWSVASGEPGHTFILISANGEIAWIQDYGAPQNRGVMYVPVEELISEISKNLE